ncbi:MAG: flavodoxin domain-containing protein [Bacilli bacterium]
MKTVIVYYSKHHGNTKKIVEAIKESDNSVDLIDVLEEPSADISSYDLIGFASGIYFSKFAKQIIEYANNYLPDEKDIFYIYTCGVPVGGYLKAMRRIAKKKNCNELGKFHCRGYDTYVFKRWGGIAKGRPNDKDIAKAVKFYESLKNMK